MYLRRLDLLQFKSYAEASFVFNPNINCLVGPNGRGKTNLLEAMYYLSMTKSPRQLHDHQCIQHGQAYFSLKAWYEAIGPAEEPAELHCYVGRDQKKVVARDQKNYKRLSDHIGQFPVVLMDPHDTDLIREGAEERRRFFDAILAQLDRVFLQDLMAYQRLLLQRNALLRQAGEYGPIDPTHLEVYHAPLTDLGERLLSARLRFLEDFLPLFQTHYQGLSEGREQVSLHLEQSFAQGAFSQALRDNIGKDIQAQRTGIGIHRDDFIFEMDGQALKKFGSQGQQKSVVVALKLAQFDLMVAKTQRKPLLLLDDIFDKLDDRRIRRLVQMMSEAHFGQVFITDARPERTKALLQELQGEISYHEL